VQQLLESIVGCEIERELALSVAYVLGQLDDLDRVAAQIAIGEHVQQRLALTVSELGIGARVEQHARLGDAGLHRSAQRIDPHLAVTRHVWIGAAGEQDLDHLGRRCRVERRPLLVVEAIDVDAGLFTASTSSFSSARISSVFAGSVMSG
jgi:hypothetical protein